MRMRTIALSMSILLAACSAAPGSSSTTAPDPAQAASTSSAPATSTSSTSSTDRGEPSPTTAQEAQPAYDVFLASVAEAVEGTRYADTAFESPEIMVSTGLALCEAIADGEDPDSVVFDYLSALAGGSPDRADDDQLVLVGALIGAAETALCPDAR